MSHRYMVVLAAFALTACDRPTAPTPTALKPGSSVSYSKATTTKSNEFFDVAFSVDNTCNGDVVFVSGRVHLVFTMTDNGTSTDLKAHINYDDLKGVGDPSGARYHLNEAQKVRSIFFPPFTSQGSENINYELVSQGSDPNLIIHVTENYSYDGINFTLTQTRFSSECRG